jgi:hypothetical protein
MSQASPALGGKRLAEPKNSKLGCEAMVPGRENWSGARRGYLEHVTLSRIHADV